MAGVDIDFSDVGDAFAQFDQELNDTMTEAGEMAVQYAKDNGDYKDRTEKLRSSNEFEVQDDGLVLKNETEYASFVEAKGFEVLSGAALEAWEFLNEKTR